PFAISVPLLVNVAFQVSPGLMSRIRSVSTSFGSTATLSGSAVRDHGIGAALTASVKIPADNPETSTADETSLVMRAFIMVSCSARVCERSQSRHASAARPLLAGLPAEAEIAHT